MKKKPEIRKFDKTLISNADERFIPVFVTAGRKIYPVNTWHEALKIMMYLGCFVPGKMMYVHDYNKQFLHGLQDYLISNTQEEGPNWAKFSPEYYVRVYPDGKGMLNILKIISDWMENINIYILPEKDGADAGLLKELKEQKIKELTAAEPALKTGSARHLLAHINGKVLSPKEKAFRRIGREFDQKVLIGDIEIEDAEEVFLKEYMQTVLKAITNGKTSVIRYDKVFAYGLVRAAVKHYAEKTYWPYVQKEYGVSLNATDQKAINTLFTNIMVRYKKACFREISTPMQNICMHAFVSTPCAGKLFDYIFEFWRIDLSYSILNETDDEGNDKFDILIDEISSGAQNIMLHTMMALQKNSSGCKKRFRRILGMIDESYWTDGECTFAGKNRITRLFNEWKDNPKGLLKKELQRSPESRKNGRGEKLLSSPTVIAAGSWESFTVFLPKQILRSCKEEDHPVWEIYTESGKKEIEPALIRGKTALFTTETGVVLDRRDLFGQITIRMVPEHLQYRTKVIPESDVRFFDGKGRNLSYTENDYISGSVSMVFVRKGKELQFVGDTPRGPKQETPGYTFYEIMPENGDVIILPDNHAVAVGTQMKEGVLGDSRIHGVKAYSGEELYDVTPVMEKIFFKADKNEFNGTLVRIYRKDQQIYAGRASDQDHITFRLEESLKDIYGYILDLKKHMREDGIYRIRISIPSHSVREYKACYIRGLNYSFDRSYYAFAETGTIRFPAEAKVRASEDWTVTEKAKTLTFRFDESDRNPSRYVFDQKLKLDYCVGEETIPLLFDIPVLYWKYRAGGEWHYQKPEEWNRRSLPDRVYMRCAGRITSAVLYVDDYSATEGQQIRFDKSSGEYYFRGLDFSDQLDRERDSRNLILAMGEEEVPFCEVICRSKILSHSLTGDFIKKRIYGFFHISGSSDYSVTVSHNGAVVEEDIPLEDGTFELETDLEEGNYDISVYEIEEDDSGFESMSYLLKQYRLPLVNVWNLAGRTVSIDGICYREKELAGLDLRHHYYIKDLKPKKLTEDDADTFYTYLYDERREELMNLPCYMGSACVRTWAGSVAVVGTVCIIFCNPSDTREVLINIWNKYYYEYEPLCYQKTKGRLLFSDAGATREEKRNEIIALDDDLYRVSAEIGGEL